MRSRRTRITTSHGDHFATPSACCSLHALTSKPSSSRLTSTSVTSVGCLSLCVRSASAVVSFAVGSSQRGQRNNQQLDARIQQRPTLSATTVYARIAVRDEEAVGSNPATPTSVPAGRRPYGGPRPARFGDHLGRPVRQPCDAMKGRGLPKAPRSDRRQVTRRKPISSRGRGTSVRASYPVHGVPSTRGWSHKRRSHSSLNHGVKVSGAHAISARSASGVT